MRFELDEDLSLLASTTRELLERESPLARARSLMEESPEGYSKALYASLGELGYPALLLGEEQGGMGALAFAAVLAEMGRVAFPGPFLELTLAVRTLAGASAPEAGAWQAKAAAGEALVVLARAGGDVGAEPARFDGQRVTGRCSFVSFGAQADALLVETGEGLALVERPGTGWNATPLATLDHAQRFAEIGFDAPAALLADAARADELLADADRLAALGAAAVLLGLMERALELAVAYTSERQAFGVPIGSFQALQHRCADMLLQAESARSAVFRAAWAEQTGSPESDYLAAVAKAWAGPAARFVCGQSIQLHGGVGFTWEYDPHILLKRAVTLEQFHGSTRSQLERALARSSVLRA